MTTIAYIIRRPKYLLMTTIISLAMIAFAAWLPNLHLITKVMTSSTMNIWEKTNLLTALLGSLETNFTPLSRTLTITSATLTGIQASLLIYYLRRSIRIQAEMGVSFTGILTSLIGVGCASCGSVVLTSLIGIGSATVILKALPFKGQEFGFMGIIILVTAIFFTMRRINQPMNCANKYKKSVLFR